MLADKGHDAAAGRDQDDVALLPLSSARSRVIGGSEVNRRAVQFILVKAATPEVTTTIQDPIRQLLRQRHGLAPSAADDFQLREPAAAMRGHAEATRSLTFLLAAVASVSSSVGGISIMNIMLVSVAERTREIGLRRARRPVSVTSSNQFLVEAVLLCVLGGIVGMVLGIGAAARTGRGWRGGPCSSARRRLPPPWVSPAQIGLSFGLLPRNEGLGTRSDGEALRLE